MKFFFSIVMIGICTLLLHEWLINSPYGYDSPRKLVAKYTNVTLSNATSIDRYCARNFLDLDGPDFYFELTLSDDDKAQLVKFFHENGKETNDVIAATELVPDSWKPSNRKLIHFYVFTISPEREIRLDLDAGSGKAWLVVWTL